MINHLKDYSFHEAIDHARSSWESRVCHWGLIDELTIKAPKFAHGSSKHAGDHRSFVNETGSSSILTIWFVNAAKFVNGSSMVLQWFVNKWWRQQKFVNNPESSSKLTNWFVNSSSMCKTCSSILTNFLAIDELSGSLTQFCGRQQLLTNHWRTWLRLWARSSILTNCLFHWRTSVVSRIFWGTMGELSNLGAYQFVNDWEIKWQTLLTTLGDRSMKQTGLLEFLTAASGFQAEMFLHFFAHLDFLITSHSNLKKESLIYRCMEEDLRRPKTFNHETNWLLLLETKRCWSCVRLMLMQFDYTRHSHVKSEYLNISM